MTDDGRRRLLPRFRRFRKPFPAANEDCQLLKIVTQPAAPDQMARLISRWRAGLACVRGVFVRFAAGFGFLRTPFPQVRKGFDEILEIGGTKGLVPMGRAR